MTRYASETDEQCAVVEYCDLRGIPVVHIPNEGKRSARYGAQLKRMGMRKGFPDLFIPVARNGYHGLFIEMKSKTGRLSEEQKQWQRVLSEQRYLCAVCYSFEEAVNTVKAYIGVTRNEKIH